MRWATVGWAAVALVGGCEQPRTELVVRVDSEVAWGAGQRVQSVVISVRRGGATGPLRSTRTTALGMGTERRPLPLYVGVIAADDDTDTPVWVEALGCGDPNGCTAATVAVAQRAVVRFVRGQTQEVPLLLASTCLGVTCASDQRCATSSGQCEGATRAQETVRPFAGTVAPAGEDAAVAMDVPVDVPVEVGLGADSALDTGSDVLKAMDVPTDTGMVADSPVIVDLGSEVDVPMDVAARDVPMDMATPNDQLAPTDVVLPPIDDGTIVCPTGQVQCGSVCRDRATDRANCGACGHACALGETCIAAACVPTPTPRPIAPLSTAIVTSRRPTLRWSLASGTDGVTVEICRDRACTVSVTTFSASGSYGAPTMDLPAGVLFWRLRGRTLGVLGTSYSPTWQFTVGARTASVDTSSGTVADFNGDGHADLVVGAFRVMSATGRAYVYLGRASGLNSVPATALTGPDGAGGAFGWSVASAGDVNGDGYADLVVGAQDAMSYTGRAYVYLGSASGLVTTPATALTGPDGGVGYFGVSVASAGDVNGDGYADLVVGAQDVMSGTGRAYVYLGSASGLIAMPATALIGPDGVGGSFGESVASAGDVNGDGYADLVVGAWRVTSATGRAYVYLGSASGLATTPATALTGPDGANGSFGRSVAGAGDVNGDGYADLVVGAPSVMSFTGRAYVYLGSASGLVTTPATAFTGPDSANGAFGFAVASAGDFNGDGYADVVVGAFRVMSGTGRVFVYLGSASGPATTPATSLTGPDGADGSFGRSVASAGDVNGDGYADLAVGAYDFMGAAGRAYVYLGSASGLVTMPATALTGPDSANGAFGLSLASVGDGRQRGPQTCAIVCVSPRGDSNVVISTPRDPSQGPPRRKHRGGTRRLPSRGASAFHTGRRTVTPNGMEG
jgi:hypothetical protein